MLHIDHLKELDEKEQKFFYDLKEGDEKAFEYFYKLYYNRISCFCKQFIYDRDKANCIAQEVFIKLWLKKCQIKKMEGVKSFLFTVAKNECLNLLKHRKIILNYQNTLVNKKEIQLNIAVLNAMEFDTATISELEKLIQNAIDSLPKQSKRVFLMKRFELKKNKDIAKELNITVKAVEANMTRALLHLKNILSDYIL